MHRSVVLIIANASPFCWTNSFTFFLTMGRKKDRDGAANRKSDDKAQQMQVFFKKTYLSRTRNVFFIILARYATLKKPILIQYGYLLHDISNMQQIPQGKAFLVSFFSMILYRMSKPTKNYVKMHFMSTCYPRYYNFLIKFINTAINSAIDKLNHK